ncbi:ABC-2 type transport system permease protein [Paenibacillus barcinonensis]|nr:ABC transporter permease subunit [Paenibacillus barcinonensis]PYE48613.1 ABC-2 type transport system permease protein [Paenibacillus barcinonensis]
MIFNRLYFNRGILYQNFRQHGWLGLVYLLLLLLSLPLTIGTTYRENAEEITSLFQVRGELLWFFAISIPVVMGLFLFRYIQAGGPADLYHSLPLKRKHLLTMNLLTGLVMILVPIWITAGVTGWVSTILEEPAYIFDGTAVWMWGVTMSIISLFMFTLTVAVGMCIGQSVLQGLTVYGICLIPIVFLGVFGLHLNRYLSGFPNDKFEFGSRDISPILRISNLGYVPPDWGELGIYAAMTVILVVLTYIFYRKRHVESATQAITFRMVKPIFRFGFMFTVVLISGAYFTMIEPNGSKYWGVVGYIIGGIAGYLGAEMIIRKSWLIWGRSLLPKFAVYAGAVALVLYVPVADWNGYASNVPTSDRVEKVRIGGEHFTYVDNQYIKIDEDRFYSTNTGYIDAVVTLHQKIVDSDLSLRPMGVNRVVHDEEEVRIDYQLKNGEKLSRQYFIPTSRFQEELMNMKNWEDYKTTRYETYFLDGDVRNIGIRSGYHRDRTVFITNLQLIREFKALLKEEILEQSYEDQLSPWETFASVEVYMNFPESSSKLLLDGVNRSATYEIKPSYSRLIEWLKQNKLYDQLRVSADEITTAQFIKQEINSPGNLKMVYADPQFIDGNPQSKKMIVTKNKKIISELLQRQRADFYTENDTVYQIKLNFIRGQNTYMMLREDDLTEDMRAILLDN